MKNGQEEWVKLWEKREKINKITNFKDLLHMSFLPADDPWSTGKGPKDPSEDRIKKFKELIEEVHKIDNEILKHAQDYKTYYADEKKEREADQAEMKRLQKKLKT